MVVYGSVETRLLTIFSDMDLCIQTEEELIKDDVIEMLKSLYNKLKEHDFIISQKPIYSAEIPVLKIKADSKI